MTGPIMTVTASPTVESRHFPFHRSHSMSDSPPGHAQPQPSPSAKAPELHRNVSSKSIPSLPAVDLPSVDFDGFDFDLSLPVSKTIKLSTNDQARTVQAATNSEGQRPRKDKMGRRRSILGRPQSWMPTSRSALDFGGSADENTREAEKEEAGEENREARAAGLPEPRPPVRSNSFASFARQSWIGTTRTPSPSASNMKEADDYVSHKTRDTSPSTSSSKLKRLSRKRPVSTIEGEGNKSSDSLSRLGTVLGKMKPRSKSALAKGGPDNDGGSTTSSVASLAPASTAAHPSNAASDHTFPSIPDDSFGRSAPPQARDPLWLAFKNLESEHAKFQAKPAPGKMTLVRNALIPFLRSYASHPSNQKLSLEHVEQRARILDKWWTGLLELLDGRSQQSVAGVDRPALLEVTTLVMMRPEWRLSTPCFTPLADRNARDRVERKKRDHTVESSSAESLSSTESDFVAESAEHNVRTMFTTNLVRQMAIVVDKLSQRHAPLSLVNFAGKACAYAFFFAPGIADILVRLWTLTPDLMRRVADEFGLPWRSKGESDDIVSLFPANMDSLGWTSVKTMSSSLRQAAKLPLAAAKVAWHGPWITRWRGRDTDLFFIFCKYYFVLSEGFMPADLPLAEKGRAPAFVLVNAQILANLDSTVHRQAAVEAMMIPPLADGVHGADAAATTLPVAPNNNVMKGMGENRLIVLLKDFLSASSISFEAARHTFAEAFMALMKASAKKTSLYDHNACFTLCDFLEESLVAYDGFVDNHRPTSEYVDWAFWFEVCKKIMESNNTMSEIRVLSLIFSVWDAITSSQSRKESVCLKWLLTEEVFHKWFTNWCPMVRAYYMRLLCWRICRDAGSANDLDARIFVTVWDRLKTVWSYYLWLKQEADSNNKLLPSSAPSYPTPGKRFMIVRTEIPVPQPGLMMGFDSFSTPMAAPDPGAYAANPSSSADTSSADQATNRKKWNIFGKVSLNFGSTSNPNDLETLRRDTAAARKPPPPPKHSGGTVTPPASDSDSLGSSPTYEALQYVFRFTLSWNAPHTMAPPNRILTRPRLPAPAQAWVTTRTRDRDGGQPQPAPGRPAPTRAVSGSAKVGLVEAARNADPSKARPILHRISTTFEDHDGFDPTSPIDRSSDEEPRLLNPLTPTSESVVLPMKPQGPFTAGARYAGRALAEWSLVVAECNSFVDRRRDEGVLGLSEVEIPALGVETFRKLG
ncbi:hypothetical protein BJ170DRAFT_456781 [Xylariales sp. AK1849]|nr:hypothetical protein BJ170DRAFT_456781 [Xylariales sp. AK1849]